MQITKKILKSGETIYRTDELLPTDCKQCKGEGFWGYSVGGETLICPDCSRSEWRPIMVDDECVGFPNPNLPESAPTAQLQTTSDFQAKVIQTACEKILHAPKGTGHSTIGAQGKLLGGYVAGQGFDEYEVCIQADRAIEARYPNASEANQEKKHFRTALEDGKRRPILRPTTAPPLKSIAQIAVSPTVAPPIDDDETDEPTALERATLDVPFDESIVPTGIIGRLFQHFLSADVPKEFAFVGALATVSAVVGDRVSFSFAHISVTPNDFHLLLAPTGAGKSASLSLVQSLLNRLESRIFHEGAKRLFILPSNFTEAGLCSMLREPNANVGINAPPQTTSGLVLNDEASGIFADMKKDFNKRLQTLLLRLWDGTRFSVITKSDGLIKIPETSITLLCASTSKLFLKEVPETAYADGTLARFCIVSTKRRATPCASISQLALKSIFTDQSASLVEELLSLFQFVAKAKKTNITKCASREDDSNVQRWFKEQTELSDDETIDGFYNRLAVRSWKFALLIATSRAYETNGEITIDGETLRQSARIADFFKAQFIQFIARNRRRNENGIDAIGKAKVRILAVIERLNSNAEIKNRATVRNLKKHIKSDSEIFVKALNQLQTDGEIRSVEYRNSNNVPVVIFEQKASALSALSALQKNNETETKANVGSAVPKTSAETPFSSAETPAVMNPPKAEPKPLSDAELVEAVLSELEPCGIFSGQQIRETLQKHCGERADVIGRLLFPARLLRLEASNRFIHRDDGKRPIVFRGLIDANGDGVIPADSEPF